MGEEAAIHIMGAGLSGLAAATLLARAGKEVHVHDIRTDSGQRFDGDFQALENWSMDVDFFDQLAEWGFDASEFKATEFDVVDLIHPDDTITQAVTPGVAYRIVERGTSEHTIDQGFKRQALAAGAQIHYKSRVKEEDCTIIACGPKGTSAVAYGEIFHTDHPNHIGFQLNDKLAPGSYSYLIIIDGIGLICTCLWRKQKKSDRFLNETIAWYEAHYPNLNRKPIKRVGGKGDFTINRNYKQDGRYYVGESGGLQDFMWGFGMRMAVWSGVLAANDILGKGDYEADVRKHLMPYVRTSVANRWLMNRVGDRTFKMMCKAWMRNQAKRGDGLIWIGNLFRPRWYKSILYRIVSPFMLQSDPKAMGRGVRRMPFRKALKRDAWVQSEAAAAIGKEWDAARRKGGATSFTDDAETTNDEQSEQAISS
ncbi:MAG: NAD(P)-binding protein [Candidatus Poseidoniaceae archaeon]|nr:NAD(P)-binding protein [Candidatus Poseidoniaceae archaeon]